MLQFDWTRTDGRTNGPEGPGLASFFHVSMAYMLSCKIMYVCMCVHESRLHVRDLYYHCAVCSEMHSSAALRGSRSSRMTTACVDGRPTLEQILTQAYIGLESTVHAVRGKGPCASANLNKIGIPVQHTVLPVPNVH